MSVRKVYRTSTEYLDVSVTADVTLNAQTVQISVDNQATWLSASWVGSAGTTRTARVLLQPNVNMPAAGKHPVFVKLTDSPETPIFATSNPVEFV